MLSVETKRTTQEEGQRRDRGFEHVAAPAVSTTLEVSNFGSQCARVRSLFKSHPAVFEGMNIPDGTNLPNLKNLFVALLLGEMPKSGQAI